MADAGPPLKKLRYTAEDWWTNSSVFLLLPLETLFRVISYLDLSSFLKLIQTHKALYHLCNDNQNVWKIFYEKWFGPFYLPRRLRVGRRTDVLNIDYKMLFKKSATELPAGALSVLLDVELCSSKKVSQLDIVEEEVRFEEMRIANLVHVLGNPRDGYRFTFKGIEENQLYGGYAQRYIDHWVVSPVKIPKSVLEAATLSCYLYMRDQLNIPFDEESYDTEEEYEEGEEVSVSKKPKMFTAEDAYQELQRIGIWVVRNYFEFERPPAGPHPGAAPYVLTFNNDWSTHYMWCTVDPVSGAIFDMAANPLNDNNDNEQQLSLPSETNT